MAQVSHKVTRSNQSDIKQLRFISSSLGRGSQVLGYGAREFACVAQDGYLLYSQARGMVMSFAGAGFLCIRSWFKCLVFVQEWVLVAPGAWLWCHLGKGVGL